MNRSNIDLLIVGGGLSGGLIALALQQYRPELTVRVVESGMVLGGNHRWSWFGSDLDTAGHRLMAPFPATCWNNGYEVRFPDRKRQLPTTYHSLGSVDFDRILRRMLPDNTVFYGLDAAKVSDSTVTLTSGEVLTAAAVIDCRGQVESDALQCGYQIFYGRHIRCKYPHKIARPIIMDATVEQWDGYRFVYSLPLSDTEIFIEDTYYADQPRLDKPTLSERVDRYCAQHGIEGETIGEETGILPVITGGNFDKFQRENRISGVGNAGMRGGFSHPLTSYSLPHAVNTALAIANMPRLSGNAVAQMLEQRARQHWHKTAYYRLLGKMLFKAAEPQKRYRVFEHFYSMPESLIERFYAARSTRLDRLRILCGKPPVPILGALRAILSKRTDIGERQDA
ncbi:lycopene beta-cyclase CrtY [Altererythrobacter indicus]|uniref:Lycopene beta-cyclase CrtY n=1 Tax=Altericroceibacterium indicum TaxID=374177 RepID=A0A845AB31_9SPHN|nr:lycopene beta-cyclase CrtY [Altericroceibacterium indicum]MXP26005.1 lycopene beta-cyclase CrtY [Altericroceibacterium indicum]